MEQNNSNLVATMQQLSLLFFVHLFVLAFLEFEQTQGWQPPTTNFHKTQNIFVIQANQSREQFMKTLITSGLVLLGTTSTVSTTDSNAHAMMVDPKTGVSYPSPGEIQQAIPTNWDPTDNPFVDSPKKIFARLDSTPDSIFYQDARFVEHIDNNAVSLLTDYISNVALQQQQQNAHGLTVLDLCSSWTSHISPNVKSNLKQVTGLGMNAAELQANPILTDWIVQDLNINPKLPYKDSSFDVVLCQLSIDYLTRPLEVLQDVGRILKPGGTVHILFSNRLFLSKAVALWTGADDIDHAYTVGCYLYYCNGNFENIQAKDLSTRKGKDQRVVGDPLYVVAASKRQ